MSSGPGLQFNLVALVPEALSLYGSIIQFSIASAGGLARRASGWITAISVAIVVILDAVSFSRKTFRREMYESN
ncbi:hypothetical protein [Paenibacillus polymyxa]|uniref:hypothetical protein n=1 Tax=Paenibacillus polymyxa TaxID=1406 RepID=UPI002AB3F9CE|nr:hypothetical protein [Paenibacillus polymyxa]MDY8025521.1 hypothetical protein [Paenibacillus polymyxa]